MIRCQQEMYDFAASIFHYCRSTTGDGVKKTLKTLSETTSYHAFNVN